MKLLIRLFLLLVFGPVILGLLLLVGVVALIGLPLLWEELVARLTAPPPERDPLEP